MISEKLFAEEERRLGKQVHFRDGVWWIHTAPFYCKPIHIFRPFPPGVSKPHLLKALMGYSHQVLDPAQATRHIQWNILQGEDLRSFSLERLRRNKRHIVRNGLRDCTVKVVPDVEPILEQMRQLNIWQAERMEDAVKIGEVLPAEYYDTHADQWREDMVKNFSHLGHLFVGSFVEDKLAAYIDLIQIEDTWMVGAVKSGGEYLKYRPVDALYFTVLSMASEDATCKRVTNGDGEERESLAYFKSQFLFSPVVVPYFSRSLLPLETLRAGAHVTRNLHKQ